MNDTSWWYAQGEQRLGPVPWATLQSLAQAGALPGDSLVWTTGMAAWQSARTVDALAPFFAGPPPLPPQPPPLPEPVAAATPAFAPVPPHAPAAAAAAAAAADAASELRSTGKLSCEIGDAPAPAPATPAWASYPRRVAASLIDLMLVGLPTIALPGWAYPEYAVWADNDTLSLKGVWLSLLPTLAFCVYQADMLSKPGEATWGKRLMGLRVLTEAGERLSWWRAAGRTLAQTYSAIVLGIGLLMPLWTRRHQALHDKIAGTVVLRTGSGSGKPEGAATAQPPQAWQMAALWLALPLSVAPEIIDTLGYVQARRMASRLHAEATAVAQRVANGIEYVPVGEAKTAAPRPVPTLASLGIHGTQGDTVLEIEDETAIVSASSRRAKMAIRLIPAHRPNQNITWRCVLSHTHPLDTPLSCEFRRLP